MSELSELRELIVRAAAAWSRSCQRHGLIHNEPCKYRSTVANGVVTLKNINGTIARYRLRLGEQGFALSYIEDHMPRQRRLSVCEAQP